MFSCMNRADNAVSKLLITRQQGVRVTGNYLKKGQFQVSSHQKQNTRSLSFSSLLPEQTAAVGMLVTTRVKNIPPSWIAYLKCLETDGPKSHWICSRILNHFFYGANRKHSNHSTFSLERLKSVDYKDVELMQFWGRETNLPCWSDLLCRVQ